VIFCAHYKGLFIETTSNEYINNIHFYCSGILRSNRNISPPVFRGVGEHFTPGIWEGGGAGGWVLFNLLFSVLCLSIIVCSFVLYLLVIVLPFLLRFTASDYPFGFLKLFVIIISYYAIVVISPYFSFVQLHKDVLWLTVLLADRGESEGTSRIPDNA
jgi:hypothetical protein